MQEIQSFHPARSTFTSRRRFIFTAAAGLFCAGEAAFGSSPPAGQGRFLFFNVAGGEGPLQVTINKSDLNPGGYAQAQSSNWINFKPGTYKIRAKHPTLGELSLSIKLRSGDSKAVLFYTKTTPSEDADKPATLKLRSALLPGTPPVVPVAKKSKKSKDDTQTPEPKAAESYQIVLFSVVPAETLKVKIGEFANVEAKHFEPSYVPRPARVPKFVRVTVDEAEEPVATLNMEDPRNHFLIFYEDASGKVAEAEFSD